MLSQSHSFRICLLSLAIGWNAAYSQNVPKNSSSTELSIPKTINGEKDIWLRGRSFVSFGDLYSITGARIILYHNKQRDSEIHIFTPKATYNRIKETARGSKKVNIRIYSKPKIEKKPNDKAKNKPLYITIIDGIGFDLSSTDGDERSLIKDQALRIRSKVKVHIQPADTTVKNTVTNITSKKLLYNEITEAQKDQMEKTIGTEITKTLTFTGDVHVVSVDKLEKTTYTLKADALTITTDQEGASKTMTAIGNVTLTQAGNIVTSRKAVFHTQPLPKPAKQKNEKGEIIEVSNSETFTFTGNPIIKTTAGTLDKAEIVTITRIGSKQTMKTEGGEPEMEIPKTEKSESFIPAFTGKRSNPLKNKALR